MAFKIGQEDAGALGCLGDIFGGLGKRASILEEGDAYERSFKVKPCPIEEVSRSKGKTELKREDMVPRQAWEACTLLSNV